MSTEPTSFRRRLSSRDMQRMMIPKRFWGAKFSEIAAEGEEPLRPKIGKFLEHLDAMMENGLGFLLWGDNGRGKSCAAAVVMKEARRRGYTALFLSAAEMKSAVMNHVRFDNDETLWERAHSVDLLVIDDLGKGVQDEKGFGDRLLDELVRHRAANLRSTWVTTNMTPSKFRELYKKSTFAAMQETVIPLRVHGDDRRAERASELREMFGATGG